MIPECSYIKPAGGKCGSPALKGRFHCYYHAPQRMRTARPPKTRYFLELSVPGNRGSVMAAWRKLIDDLDARRIETQLAGKLLYALTLALSDGKASAPETPNLAETGRGIRIFKSSAGDSIYATRLELQLYH